MSARVLVVDDSPTMRGLITAVLNSDPDVSVVGQAGDAMEARAAIKQLNPDVVTLDIQMPGMDGLAALREMKRRWPSLPVVVLASAASNGPEIVMEALELGAFEFVDKGRFRSMDFQLMGDEVVRKVRASLGRPTPSPADEPEADPAGRAEPG